MKSGGLARVGRGGGMEEGLEGEGGGGEGEGVAGRGRGVRGDGRKCTKMFTKQRKNSLEIFSENTQNSLEYSLETL